MDYSVFDPVRAGQYEALAYKQYYSHQFMALARTAWRLLREQFNMGRWATFRLAIYSARASANFRKRADTKQADILADLQRYYKILAKHSARSLDVNLLAKLELRWWIEHRKKGYGEPSKELVDVLATWAVAFFGCDETRAKKFAKARAQAMCMRHTASNEGSMTDQDWEKVEALLIEAWSAIAT